MYGIRIKKIDSWFVILQNLWKFDDKKNIETLEDIQFFYYDVEIRFDDEVVFEVKVRDYPKLSYLADAIDELVTYDMNKAYLLEDIVDKDYFRKVTYHQISVVDGPFDDDYFYKLERYDTLQKQPNETSVDRWTEYTLTVTVLGNKPYNKAIHISDISAEELLELENTARSFCEKALQLYGS